MLIMLPPNYQTITLCSTSQPADTAQLAHPHQQHLTPPCYHADSHRKSAPQHNIGPPHDPACHDEEVAKKLRDKPHLESSKLTSVDRETKHWLNWKEVRTQCKLAGPLILSNLLTSLLQMISATFVGHTSSIELSGASLTYSFCTVTGYSVLMGMSGALETLCGQAFGAGEYGKVGLYLHRSIFVLNAVAVPVAISWLYIEQIYLAFGQDAQLASKAGAYGIFLIPTLFAVSFSYPLVKFLQAQSLVVPVLACFVTTLICHVPICWVLVFRSSLGYKGAALANSISSWLNTLLLSLYVGFSPTCALSRVPISRETLQDVTGLLKVAVPAASMLCLEWWSYEVLVVISGFLSNPKLQAGIVAICVNSETLLYAIPGGMAAAVSTRVSNELGAGNHEAAHGAARVARVLALMEAGIVITFLFLARKVWGQIYSNDKVVIDAVASFVPYFATSSALDALQSVLSGIVRGAGRMRIGAYINLASFYVVGLPIGCLLAFIAGREEKGLWLGLIAGITIQFSSYLTCIHTMDWRQEAKEAAARVGGPAV
ncbi:hypothetical protein L7F22_000399 [Adiantum nelumboides]|nr:hypothetical protein [Adiantum nelumboides]